MSSNLFTLNSPADAASMRTLRGRFPHLPESYLSFLARSDGCEGFLGISPGYIRLWRVAEVDRFTEEYELPIYCPGYVAVGSSGGGELFVYPLHEESDAIYCVPAIGMEPSEVKLVSPTFRELEVQFGKEWSGA